MALLKYCLRAVISLFRCWLTFRAAINLHGLLLKVLFPYIAGRVGENLDIESPKQYVLISWKTSTGHVATAVPCNFSPGNQKQLDSPTHESEQVVVARMNYDFWKAQPMWMRAMPFYDIVDAREVDLTFHGNTSAPLDSSTLYPVTVSVTSSPTAGTPGQDGDINLSSRSSILTTSLQSPVRGVPQDILKGYAGEVDGYPSLVHTFEFDGGIIDDEPTIRLAPHEGFQYFRGIEITPGFVYSMIGLFIYEMFVNVLYILYFWRIIKGGPWIKVLAYYVAVMLTFRRLHVWFLKPIAITSTNTI